ncbi:MAG: divalent-cation tolerance protein CutA [Halobacteriales archaeon]|nr:divalent-cation tolerance protein CutA [Halobacteriales archaeon]
MPTGYVTVPRELSEEIAYKIVESHLAACVNIIECSSVYEWGGEIQNEEESILIIKTSDEMFEEMVSRIKSLIPYEIPCIERFDEGWTDEMFKKWRDEFVNEREKEI